MNKFSMKDLGPASEFLGMKIEKKPNSLSINQKKFINELLEKFNLIDCNPCATPMEVGLKLPKLENGKKIDVPYQELIGGLLFLANVSRPDISFAVSYLSRFNNNPDQEHWLAAKRVLRFLKGTRDMKLTFSNSNLGCDIIGFSDSDFAADTIERKSVSGYVFKMSNGAITWMSKKQGTVALSTSEAEYMAMSTCFQEALWLLQLQKELTPGAKLTVNCDNQSAIFIAKNSAFSQRTKHIDVRHHFIRECIAENKILLEYTNTEEMVADTLTKSLPNPKFKKFQYSMGVN